MKKQLLKIFSACLPALRTATVGGPVGMAFIVTAMLFSVSANAQIVYTDVNPDSTLYSNGTGPGSVKNYDLDLNNDGNNDFNLKIYRNTSLPQYGSWASATPLNSNAVKDTFVNSLYCAIPLQFNAVIDSNLLLHQYWQTSGVSIIKDATNSGNSGLWNSLSDYYLGLRLLLSGQTYYGWVRLRVDVTISYASLIVKDYAYNSIPNQPILAGQTTATGIIDNSSASSINLFPNPADNHLTILLGSNNNKKVEVTITDITGKLIYTTIARETQKLEVNTEDFKEGIYVIKIQAGGFITTKKLVVEK